VNAHTDEPPGLARQESSLDDPAFAELIEDIVNRAQAGAAVDLAECIRQHPQYADALRRLLPAVQGLAELGRSGSGAGDSLLGDGAGPGLGVLGDFRLLRQVGRGGMGIVYEAEQISLGRRVALKVLPFAAMMDPRHLQRFQNEARAAASLEHPHIVPVYGVGCERGVHYYAMRFIDATTLAEFINVGQVSVPVQIAQERNPVPRPASGPPETLPLAGRTEQGPPDTQACRRIAQWGIEAATALEYAHTCGVVHRDIKPSNLLIDTHGKLWITDFGLAKFGGNPELTMTGDIVGTLRYMSPEQALAKHELVDHRTDVYSLGVTLYELLAGKPAIAGTDRQEILHRIAADETPPLRSRNKSTPIELETIVHKAIAKDPNEGYGTAQELADDLKRFINHEPLRARRPTVVERMKKWSRRKQAVLLPAFVVASVAIVALASGSLLLWQEKDRTEQALRDVDAQRLQVERAALANRRYAHACDLRLAYQAWSGSQVAEARERLKRYLPKEGEEDVRNFAWHYLWRLCHCERAILKDHSDAVFWATFAPDGQTLATCGRDYTIRLWDFASGKVKAILRDHTDDVNSLSYSPDGKLLASASDDGTVRIWDVATETVVRTFSLPHWMYRVAFSPDGKRLAASGRDRVLYVWDPATDQELWRLQDLDMITFSPDSQLLAARRGDKVLVLCDVAHGTITTVTDANGGLKQDRAAAAFSPDGQTLVTPGPPDGHLCFWDLRSRGLKFKVVTGQSSFYIGFSANGERLVTTCTGQRVIVRDAHTGRVLADFRGHDNWSYTAAFSPDEKLIVSPGWDHCLRIWDPTRFPGSAIPTQTPGPVMSLAFVHNELLIFASPNQKVRTCEPGARRLGSPPVDLGEGASMAVAPGAGKVAVGTPSGHVHVAGLDGSNHVSWKPHESPVIAVALSSDAKVVASEGSDGQTLLQAVGGQFAHTLRKRGVGQSPQVLAFLSTASLVRLTDNEIEILDSLTGASQSTLRVNIGLPGCAALAPTETLLAAGSQGGGLRLR
jgi:WD40 repeat protein/serine/threonine protein kinase